MIYTICLFTLDIYYKHAEYMYFHYFQVMYSGIIGEESSYVYRTWLYLAASASAEFFADIALSPMEAAKVKIQTTPGFANTLREAWPRIYKEEGRLQLSTHKNDECQDF